MGVVKEYKRKIDRILAADYNHEVPDQIRSKKFQQAFKRMLKKFFPDYEIITLSTYCEANGFIKNGNACVYYSTQDYRWPMWGGSWSTHILFRRSENEKDYHGGANHFADLEDFEKSVSQLLEQIAKEGK